MYRFRWNENGFLKCTKGAKTKNSKVWKTSKERIILDVITNDVITNAYHKHFDEPGRKPKKMWVDKGNELYNRSMKLWLQDNDA